MHKQQSFNNNSREVPFFAPVMRRNAAYCKFSIINFSCLKQLSKNMSAYSNKGRTKERKSAYLLIEYLKALKRCIRFFALLVKDSMCSDHVIFLVNIKPRCL